MGTAAIPNRLVAVACLLFAVGLTACNGDKRSSSSTAASTRHSGPAPTQSVDSATTGRISGVILLSGTAPVPTKLAIGEPGCKAAQSGTVYDERVLAKGGKLQNSFVYIRSGLEAYAFDTPKSEVVIDQKGCIYKPRIVGVQVDQTLTFVNSDSLMHNVRTSPTQNDSTNFAMPTRGQRRTQTFESPEVAIKTGCDVHPWMRSYVGVVAHPHFAVTGADGAFAFNGVPPGSYVIEAWHEVYGRQSKKLTLKAKGSQQIELSFTAK
ncbi:MAG: carboxypeptidase regulatory-like domain-containing protein [Polyangiaceae bacterium]